MIRVKGERKWVWVMNFNKENKMRIRDGKTEEDDVYMTELFPYPRPRVESLFLYDKRFLRQLLCGKKVEEKKNLESGYFENGDGI